MINCRCVTVAVLKALDDPERRALEERIGKERIAEVREAKRLEQEAAKALARQERIDKSLRNDYNNSVNSGMLSPLVSFEEYKGARDLFDENLVGLTTADGVEIKGYSKHFVERYFGTRYQRIYGVKSAGDYIRDGVPLESIVEALTTDSNPIKSRLKRSNSYSTTDAQVTLNPSTGNLVQTNPL